jgi:hypothetical protein
MASIRPVAAPVRRSDHAASCGRSGSRFISYACVDGANLAARLHADLKRRGVDAWFDTSAVRGWASWTEEIEHAIDGCHSVLAVMSSGSFRSPVCRAEKLRALRKSKRVVPLLGFGFGPVV